MHKICKGKEQTMSGKDINGNTFPRLRGRRKTRRWEPTPFHHSQTQMWLQMPWTATGVWLRTAYVCLTASLACAVTGTTKCFLLHLTLTWARVTPSRYSACVWVHTHVRARVHTHTLTHCTEQLGLSNPHCRKLPKGPMLKRPLGPVNSLSEPWWQCLYRKRWVPQKQSLQNMASLCRWGRECRASSGQCKESPGPFDWKPVRGCFAVSPAPGSATSRMPSGTGPHRRMLRQRSQRPA